MKLIFVRDSKSRGYVVLGIELPDGARVYTVDVSLYSSIGAPIASQEISDDALERIKFCDEVFRATKKALSLLSYSDNNRRNLILKLRRAGFSAAAAEECVSEMLRLGYINETRQLERLVLREANVNLCGKGKIVPKLVSKGYARADVESVIDSLEASGEIDFDLNKQNLILKKLGDSAEPDEVKKLLYKNGFAFD